MNLDKDYKNINYPKPIVIDTKKQVAIILKLYKNIPK